MKRIHMLLVFLAVLSLLLAPLSVASIVIIRSTPSGPVDAVVIIAKAVTALLGILLAAQVAQVFVCLRRLDAEDEPESLLEAAKRVNTAGIRLTWLSDALLWSVIVGNLLHAVRELMLGDVGAAAFDVLMAALLMWMQLRSGGGGGRRQSIGKLIGEKSRALVDRLVEVQKGMQPLPGPA